MTFATGAGFDRDTEEERSNATLRAEAAKEKVNSLKATK